MNKQDRIQLEPFFNRGGRVRLLLKSGIGKNCHSIDDLKKYYPLATGGFASLDGDEYELIHDMLRGYCLFVKINKTII